MSRFPNLTRLQLLVTAFALLAGASLLIGSCVDDDTGRGRGTPAQRGDQRRYCVNQEGHSLIVALPSNPSTGFAWAFAPPEPAQRQMQGEPTYVPPGSTSPVVGAAGTQVFTFKAVARGTAKLDLIYARPFEKGVPPEKTFTVTVEVE